MNCFLCEKEIDPLVEYHVMFDQQDLKEVYIGGECAFKFNRILNKKIISEEWKIKERAKVRQSYERNRTK